MEDLRITAWYVLNTFSDISTIFLDRNSAAFHYGGKKWIGLCASLKDSKNFVYLELVNSYLRPCDSSCSQQPPESKNQSQAQDKNI